MRPVQPGYINCLRLMFETCPAGGAGTRVSAELSLGLLLKPLKKVEQYERFPPGSLEEEQRLVLLDSCLTTVPTGAGPPLPRLPERLWCSAWFPESLRAAEMFSAHRYGCSSRWR